MTDVAHADETPPGPARPHPLRTTFEWAAIIAVALIAALGIKTWLLQPFYIPSESMEPTLMVNDRVLVAKQSRHPSRGDIVVFTRPPGVVEGRLNKDIIKRVVALPGETVEGREGKVFVNGAELPERYLPPGVRTSDFAPQTIPAGRLWVMGDNRAHSQDSRVFGPIERRTVVGRAFVIFWPVGDFQRL